MAETGMPSLTISLLESGYLLYMFHLCITSVDFNVLMVPLGTWNWNYSWLKHLSVNERGLRICPFGRIAILFFTFILVGRHFFFIPQCLILTAFILSFMLSMLNLNAIIYLLPVWMIEWAVYFKT